MGRTLAGCSAEPHLAGLQHAKASASPVLEMAHMANLNFWRYRHEKSFSDCSELPEKAGVLLVDRGLLLFPRPRSSPIADRWHRCICHSVRLYAA